MLEHGGNLRQAAKQYGIPLAAWLDLSTGINPYHYPVPEIPSSAWQRLPEAGDGLIEAACAYYGCEFLLPVSGSQAAIQVLPTLRPACRVAMPRNMYQEHAHAWQRNGHTITLFDGAPSADNIAGAEVVLVCNPNNPTGNRFSQHELLEWHQMLAVRGGWLIVDEAFMDTTPEESIAEHTDLNGLIVLRSLGKFFGLAGVRVGFLLAPRELLTLAQAALGPWAVTGPSRLVAKQALQDKQWQVEMRAQLTNDSQRLVQLLGQYGLPPQGGTHLFQQVASVQAADIQHALAAQGVWVRLFAQHQMLRFGLPKREQFAALERALKNMNKLTR